MSEQLTTTVNDQIVSMLRDFGRLRYGEIRDRLTCSDQALETALAVLRDSETIFRGRDEGHGGEAYYQLVE